MNPKLIDDFEKVGLHFVGKDIEGERMEILELEGHPYFAAAQFHPEFLSRPLKPHAMFYGFILAACGKLKSYLKSNVGAAVGVARPMSPAISASPPKDGGDEFTAYESVPSPLKFSATAGYEETAKSAVI